MISTTTKPTFLDYQIKLKNDFLQLKSYSEFAQKRLGGRVFSDEILYNGFSDIDKYVNDGIQRTHNILYHFAGNADTYPSMQTGMAFASCYNQLLELKNTIDKHFSYMLRYANTGDFRI